MATPEPTTLTDSPLPARVGARPLAALPRESDEAAPRGGLVGFLFRLTVGVAVFDVAVWVAVNAVIPVT